MEDLPNGFLSNPKRNASFESAGEALRKSRHEIDHRADTTVIEERQRKAMRDGWRVVHSEDPESGSKTNIWGGPNPSTGFLKELDHVSEADHPLTSSSFEEIPNLNYETIDEIPEQKRRWSWIEISLGAIQNNIYQIRRTLKPSTMFMAIVKSNAYGHGAVQVAKTAVNAGAEYLGVATVDEGVELRKAGLKAPILMLSEPPIEAIPLLLAYSIMPAVASEEFALKYAEVADQAHLKAPFHLKVNTGMNRVGVRYDHVVDFMSRLSFHRALDLRGTFTHFATADSIETMDFNLQKQRFEGAVEALRHAGIDPGIVHAANSAATLRYPEVQYDMVRPGLAMYGHFPSQQTYGSLLLMPAMSIYARITQVNHVPVGEGVSYGLLYRSNGFTKTCTIPVGYADGLRRGLSGRIQFAVDGELHPQVGNICMDQCMLEIDQRLRSNFERIDPKVGDEVMIIGAQGDTFLTIENMADILNTIPYEILISFGESRLPKFYVN